MAQFDFGGVMEEVITSEEFSLQRAREVLQNETIAVLGYGVQGPGQALNMRDNGFRVIVGQREGGTSWERAVADGFVPRETLFPIEEASGSVINSTGAISNVLKLPKTVGKPLRLLFKLITSP